MVGPIERRKERERMGAERGREERKLSITSPSLSSRGLSLLAMKVFTIVYIYIYFFFNFILRRKEDQRNKGLWLFELIKQFVSSPKADVTEVLGVISNCNS